MDLTGRQAELFKKNLPYYCCIYVSLLYFAFITRYEKSESSLSSFFLLFISVSSWNQIMAQRG